MENINEQIKYHTKALNAYTKAKEFSMANYNFNERNNLISKKMDLPEEQVKVKISTCQKCDGIVRCAIEHKMDEKDEKDFYKEVSKYKLNVQTISLLDYRANSIKWCECK